MSWDSESEWVNEQVSVNLIEEESGQWWYWKGQSTVKDLEDSERVFEELEFGDSNHGSWWNTEELIQADVQMVYHKLYACSYVN